MKQFTVDEIMDKKHRCFGNIKKCGVYQITNIANCKKYIGSSKTILQRWKNHIRELDTNKHKNMFLQEDWNFYGRSNFRFEILIECSENERYDIEQQFLDELFPFYRSGNGYNISEKSTNRNEPSVRLYSPKNVFDDYYYVKASGLRPYIMDGEHCRNTCRDDLLDECYAKHTYRMIIRDAIEDGTYDDWNM